MKDLPLSLLSRGCGQFIPSDGRRHGRLDVCFTPEDYYIWKSQNTLLRLSTSGCLLSRQESTLPKTYSTRRGALLLYSQGLVTLKTCPLATSDGKQHFGQYMGSLPVQQMKHQRSISTTLAIMNYTHGQERRYRPPPTILPPLRLPQPPDLKYSETLPSHTQQQHTWEQHVRLKPQSPSVERITAHQDSPNEENVDGSNRKMRLDVFLQMPTVSRNSSPQIKHHSWDHLEPPNSEKEDFMNAPSTSLEHNGQVQDSEHPQHSDTNFPCISQHRGCDRLPDDEAVSKQLMNRNRHGGQCAFLPPLKDGQAFSSESNQVHTDRLKSGALSTNEQHIELLPPIEETRRLGNNPQDVKSGKNSNGLQQLLFLPRLIPEKFEENGQKKKKEITEKKQEGLSQKVREGQASEKGFNILLTPGEECPAPVGLLTSVTGKKGPGRQSSMAFLQNRLLNLQHLCEDSSDTHREVVRGLLPLELRDLENGQSVGSLILGPDGEIIHLSVFDQIQDTPQGKALEVLSAEGEKLPWVIMLQPENTHTEEERETDVPLGNTQEHLINKQLLDPQRSAETDPGSVRTSADSDAENYKELKDSRSETKRSKTRKNPKAGGVNIGTMSTPDWTQLKRESSQDTGLKDTDKKVSSGRHLSQLPLLEKPVYKADVTQNMSLAEAQIQNTEEERKSSTELQDREETTTTKEKKIKSLRPNSNRQNTLMKRKEGEKSAVHNPQPMSVPKQKEKENTDAADTLSSVTKRFKDTEGRTRVEKMNLDDHFRDEEASVERKKKSSRMLKHREIVSDDPFGEEASVERKKKKSSRGMLKHREIISEKTHNPVDTDETNSDQEIDEESHQKASTQIDKDHFPTKELTLNTEKPGSSVTSLRSTVNSSGLKQSSSQKSVSSSCESGTLPASAAALSMSRSRLSSCSTVMIPEERLMLNPTKPEVAVTEWTARDREDRATTLEAQRAESQRQKEERKRRKQEEEERRQEQREQTEQKMKNELQNERQRRVEELRLKKQAAEEERKNREEEEQKHERQQQELREREIRRQQERRRQMEKFQRKREEEEQRRKAEAENSRLLEERRLQEENRKLQEMDENERIEYLRKKQEEEDARKREEEEQQRREEEAALLAAEKAKVEEALLAREMALLHQKLSFKRGLILEAEGLEKSQGISRPWTFSYFTLVQLLGLS